MVKPFIGIVQTFPFFLMPTIHTLYPLGVGLRIFGFCPRPAEIREVTPLTDVFFLTFLKNNNKNGLTRAFLDLIYSTRVITPREVVIPKNRP